MPNPISERTLYLAKLFSDAIRTNPNDVGKTTLRLVELCGSSEVLEEILAGMSDPSSELAVILTNIGTAFHSRSESDAVPDNIEPADLASMAEQIRARSGLR